MLLSDEPGEAPVQFRELRDSPCSGCLTSPVGWEMWGGMGLTPISSGSAYVCYLSCR